MANIYVRSTDGNNADNGSTWALAKSSLAGACAIVAAGDTIFVSQAHSESIAASPNLSGLSNATQANPIRIICANDGAEPPTAVATTGVIQTTGDNGISIGTHIYVYGVTFRSGSGATGVAQISISGGIFENCIFDVATSDINSRFVATGAGARFTNSGFKFANAAQGIAIVDRILFRGCYLVSGTTSPTTIFVSNGADERIEGFDFSNATAGMNLFGGGISSGTARNCKMPASWSGNLIATPLGIDAEFKLYNSDNADTNYKLWIERCFGSIKSETTITKTNGATDSTTPLSWKMVSNADADAFPFYTLKSEEIVIWNETVGSAITVTIDILHDSVTNLKNDEIYLDVQYLGTSGFPISSFLSDSKADVLATAADQDASTATWNTTGITNPNKQKLSVTFTPQEKGVIHGIIRMAKSSYTIYIDPKLQLS